MKRITIIFLLFCGVNVFAQSLDTLRIGVQYRDPTYNYMCWIDEHPGAFWEVLEGSPIYPKIQAVGFNNEGPLTMIGIACAIEIRTYEGLECNDTLAEYFQVYEVDKSDSSFRKVAEARWDTFQPTKCMELIQDIPYKRICPPVYEAYFDTAITVYDSFYLAYTTYNNASVLDTYWWNNQLEYFSRATLVYPYSISQPASRMDSTYFSCVYNAKRKYLPVEGDFYSNKYRNFQLIDTTIWYNSASLGGYSPIFPIFDTTGNHVDTCADVSNFAVVGTDSVSALLSWDSTSRSIGWELAYGPQGTAPEDATVLEMSSTVHRLSGLDSGAWYVAYVRAKCGEEEYSNWSSGVEFYIAGDTTSRELSIHTSLLEQYTYLMPNPAQDVVSVFSSFSMNRLEVFSMNGVLMERMDCEGLSTQLTVSGYPRGAYIVKVYTPKGVATKKLVVK